MRTSEYWEECYNQPIGIDGDGLIMTQELVPSRMPLYVQLFQAFHVLFDKLNNSVKLNS